MSELREIPITSLLLDHENPRLAEGQTTQLDTLHAVLRAEGPKTLALAECIAEEGLSPIDRFLVMPDATDSERFVRCSSDGGPPPALSFH